MDYSTDFVEDYEIPQGTDFLWDYSWEPLDLTGCTASFVADFGTYACTLTMVTSGDDVVSEVSVQIPNAATSTLTPGNLYAWKVLVSFPTGPATVLPFGHGQILIV